MEELNENAVPAVNTPEWKTRARWFSRCQIRLYNEYFIRDFVRVEQIKLVKGQNAYPLPGDFRKHNGLLAWSEVDNGAFLSPTDPTSNLIFATNPFDSRISIEIIYNQAEAVYKAIRYPVPINTTPVFATVYYYAQPLLYQNPTDNIILPGEMQVAFATWRYYKRNFQRAAASDAQEDFLALERDYLSTALIPAPGNPQAFQSFLKAYGAGNQKQYYQGRTNTNTP